MAQVNTWTFATNGTIGDVVTVTIGTASVTYATTSATVSVFVPLLQAYLSSLSSTAFPQFAEIIWTSTSSAVIGTAANSIGKPFIATFATNSATTTINGGASSTGTATIANAGPYDVSCARNYSNNLLPVGACIAPVQAAATATAGGSLVDSTPYYWVITATNANGETTISNQQTLTPSGSNQTAVLSWAAVTNATGYKIYRSTTSGTYGSSSLRATIGSGSTVTYNDTGAATTTGQPPSQNGAIGDTFYVQVNGAQLLYNLQALANVVLTQRQITSSNVIIGLPKTNVDSTPYPEYRQDYLQMTATVDIVNTSSGRIKLDQGSGLTNFTCYNSGQGAEQGIPAVLVKGTNSSNVWNFFGGVSSVSWFATDSASVIYTGRVDSGASVVCGVNCVNDTWYNYGGNLALNSAVATLLEHPGQSGGTTVVNGTGTVAQLTLQSGTCYYNSTGELNGNPVLANNSVCSFDGDQRPKTVANPFNIYSSQASVTDSYSVVTGGYTLNYVNCSGTVIVPTNGQVVIIPNAA